MVRVAMGVKWRWGDCRGAMGARKRNGGDCAGEDSLMVWLFAT